MAKKESTQLTVIISKEKSWTNRIILPLDKERLTKFNKGEDIEVTEEELKSILDNNVARWLEVKK